MEKDLFLLVPALIVSAVFRINLLRVIAVVDIADRFILYHDFKEIVMHDAPSLEERFSCARVLVSLGSVFIHIDAKKTKKKMPIQLWQARWAAAVTQLVPNVKSSRIGFKPNVWRFFNDIIYIG